MSTPGPGGTPPDHDPDRSGGSQDGWGQPRGWDQQPGWQQQAWEQQGWDQQAWDQPPGGAHLPDPPRARRGKLLPVRGGLVAVVVVLGTLFTSLGGSDDPRWATASGPATTVVTRPWTAAPPMPSTRWWAPTRT